MSTLTSRRALAAAATAGALLLAVPASSAAKLVSFGSTLKATASITKARQADAAYWQARFADGASPRSPARGQVKSIKVKGIALSNWRPGAGIGGETMFHLQALRKLPNGTFKVLRSSQALYLPGKGNDPQKITTFRPINFCIAKGDYLVYNTVGGWDGIAAGNGPYPMGTPLQIFAKVPGATVSEYGKANGTNNGAVITSGTRGGTGQELLMRATVGTGANATGLCPGGTGR